jgi:parvulin-like peptidyl-prolyl isomerase
LADFTKPEQVLVSQILLKIKADASADDKKKAQAKLKDIQKELEKGGDFAALAKKYSEDASGPSGGMMGFVLRGQTEKPLEEAAFNLDPEQTAIVETKTGLHLIKATDKKTTEVIPYEDVAEKLKNFLKQQEIQKKIDDFIKNERKNAKIELFLKPWTAKKE